MFRRYSAGPKRGCLNVGLETLSRSKRGCLNVGAWIRSALSTAGNSMTGSERPFPEPLLKKRSVPQPYWRGENSGNALEASNAFNYGAWGIPAVLSRVIPGNALRAFPGSFRSFSGISSEKSQPYWGYGPLKPAAKRQESATFLQRSFWMLHCSFSLAAAKLLVQMTLALQTSQCCSALFARSFPKIAALQLPFSLVACCRAGV